MTRRDALPRNFTVVDAVRVEPLKDVGVLACGDRIAAVGSEVEAGELMRR